MLMPLSAPPPASPVSLPDDGMPLAGGPALFDVPAARRHVVPTARGPVLQRPVTPLDTHAVDRFVRGLSPTSRFRRFHSAVHRLTDRQLAGVVDVDHRGRETLLAVAGSGAAARVVGMGQYLVQSQSADSVDLAVVVDDEWQRLGLGRLLLEATVDAARESGFRTATAYVQAENRAMLTLLRGTRLPMARSNEGAIVEVLIDLTRIGVAAG